MNYTRIIQNITIAFAALLVVGGLVWWLWPAAGVPQDTTQTPQQPVSPGQGVVGVGTNPVPGSQTPVQPQHSVAEARAAFLQATAAATSTQVDKVVVVSNYALLEWVNGPMGGEALLKYDTTARSWSLAASTGGAFSVAGLHALGVPARTVLALLKGLKD